MQSPSSQADPQWMCTSQSGLYKPVPGPSWGQALRQGLTSNIEVAARVKSRPEVVFRNNKVVPHNSRALASTRLAPSIYY